MVFVSSRNRENGKCFRSSDEPAPKDAYGESKRLAEEGLIKVSRETGMNFIILRPPLILGKNAKGNLGLIELLNVLRLPIPFGGINSNVRSYITTDLLNRILLQCISSEKALNRVILIREKSMISTSELIKLVFSENRRKSSILKISIGLFFSVLIYYLFNFFNVLGKTEKINLISSIIIPLVLLFLTNSIMIRKFDEK